MKPPRHKPARRWLLAVLAVLLLVLPGSSTQAQRRADRGGHALDASLQLGSGGYNRPVRTNSFVSKPLYKVSGSGEMRYSSSSAFGRPRQFQAPRRAGNYQAPTSYDPFRAYAGNVRQRGTHRSPRSTVGPISHSASTGYAWQPQPRGAFMNKPVYQPAASTGGWRQSGGNRNPAPLALGRAQPYQPGATANRWDVRSLFGN